MVISQTIMKTSLSISIVVAILFAGFAAQADPSIAAYEKSKPCYTKLVEASGKSAPEKDWRSCIDQFNEVYRNYPTGARAAASLYSSAKLKKGLYDKDKDRAELEGAVKDLNLLVREFPKSSLADDALYLIGVIRRDDLKQPDRAQRAFSYLVENYPDGDMATKARVAMETGGAAKAKLTADAEAAVADMSQEAAPVAAEPVVEAQASPTTPRDKVVAKASSFDRAALEEVKLTKSKGQTRVELILDKEVEFTVEYTELGPRTMSPATLELSILHSYPKGNIEKKVDLDSAQLISYKIGKLVLSSGIKASFVLAPGTRYDIKNQKGVISVSFFSSGDVPAPAAVPAKGSDAEKSKAGEDLSELRIVIDPGHGGDDEGAVGPKGTLEKDVTLALSKELEAMLRKEVGAKVWLTRTSDKTLTLEQRHEFAARKKADLFISVHANASRESSASGVETYYLNNATDEAARKLAVRENRSSGKKLTQVEHILSTMLQNYDAAQSRDLASDVQSRLAKRVGNLAGGGVQNRGVRSAMFYVLVGARCPAILVEAAFISNPREEKLLRTDAFQRKIAQAVTEGVKLYLKQKDSRVVSL